MRFTTSWDDGYALDLPLAEMLARHGCKGTFYVSPVAQHGQCMLSAQEIKTLSRHMEIGAHSMTHPKLATIPLADAEHEVRDSKAWVEELTGKGCDVFCYPKGNFDDAVKTLAKDAGFLGARTVEQFRFDVPDPYAMPTSLQAYPFPWRARYRRWWHVLDPLSAQRAHRKTLDALDIPWKDRWSWLSLAKSLFLHALQTDAPVFHLWGHSAEAKRLGLWDDIDSFLSFVATQKNVEHVTNAELLSRR